MLWRGKPRTRPARARIGPDEEEAAQHERAGFQAEEREVGCGVEDGLAEHVNLATEHDGQAQHDELEAPAHRADRGAERLLQVHQHQHERREQTAFRAVPAGPTRAARFSPAGSAETSPEECPRNPNASADRQARPEDRQRNAPAG